MREHSLSGEPPDHKPASIRDKRRQGGRNLLGRPADTPRSPAIRHEGQINDTVVRENILCHVPPSWPAFSFSEPVGRVHRRAKRSTVFLAPLPSPCQAGLTAASFQFREEDAAEGQSKEVGRRPCRSQDHAKREGGIVFHRTLGPGRHSSGERRWEVETGRRKSAF